MITITFPLRISRRVYVCGGQESKQKAFNESESQLNKVCKTNEFFLPLRALPQCSICSLFAFHVICSFRWLVVHHHRQRVGALRENSCSYYHTALAATVIHAALIVRQQFTPRVSKTCVYLCLVSFCPLATYHDAFL